MEFTIDKVNASESPLLKKFLYEAIFIPQGGSAPAREIINEPQLQVYIKDFGSGEHDHALLARVDGRAAGAVWVRIMNDYGHVDEQTPSMAISLFREYRGAGIGTALLQQMLKLLKRKHYEQVSLSVQKENYALKMYQKAGFVIIDQNEEEYIMVKYLQD